MNQNLWYAGVLIVVLGVTLAAVPTGSFSSVSGQRPVDVSVVDDDRALVALEPTGEVVTSPSRGNAVAVGSIVNNLGTDVTVDYTASIDVNALSLAQSGGSPTLSRGGEHQVTAYCRRPNAESGVATLVVEVDSAQADGVSISGATLEARVEYDCTSGNGGGNPGNGDDNPGNGGGNDGGDSGDGSDGGDGNPSGPSNGVAYVDSDEDIAYDDGERVLTEQEVATFDDDDAVLVVGTDNGTIDNSWRAIDISAKRVVVTHTTFTSGDSVDIEAETGIEFTDVTVNSDWGEVTLSGESITLRRSTIDAKNGKIELAADGGTLDVRESAVRGKNDKVELTGETVQAGGATIRNTNDEIELAADDGPVNVTGATLDNQNGKVTLSGESVQARGASISTRNGKIDLTADDGPVDIRDASLQNRNRDIEVSGETVSARNASITVVNGRISLDADDGLLDIENATVHGEKQIDLTGERIGAAGASIETKNAQIDLRSGSSDVTLDGATVKTKNAQITVESAGDLRANESVFETTNADVSLSADGDVFLRGADLRTTNAELTVELGDASATLSVDGLEVEDRDDTLDYDPGGAGVTGTPSAGQVRG
ncbi:hypothetical protein C454_12663 [Haloferax gibbonsii ATCC 33959]|uniref:Uncharacterized protein n=1 Tax=Haloferax gibbonsii (strain ATCC 33959 / DSM 4427 / JCM 8863 / NBRC 102184 / NCIMB 2188 / Ma 2.38) TaxID=1227459 RepID=M0H6F1_HALGM|nr:hypothetical protein [Haloferax gibbonsii]ELZ80055.1 hypothetical protein C454_12663 [Haloferax gibbonsii ATCC 33959]